MELERIYMIAKFQGQSMLSYAMDIAKEKYCAIYHWKFEIKI